MKSLALSDKPVHYASRPCVHLCRNIVWLERWGRSLSCLRRVTSGMMLAALPITLLWPYWQHTLPGGVAQHLVSAIYEFPSDEMPRCEQFVRHTDTAAMIGPVACETSPAQMMV